MSRYIRTPLILVSAAFSALLVLAWALFAPPILGGQTSYIMVNGNSMTPFFQPGDLALLRTSRSYQAGDVAAYHYPDLGLVIHRIQRSEGGRFVMKGDYNSWEDGYQPANQDFVGKFWFKIPKGARVVAFLRKPGMTAGLVGLGALLLGGVFMRFPKINTKKKRKVSGLDNLVRWIGQSQEIWFFIFALIAFLGIMLGIFAFIKPVSIQTADNIPYRQAGKLEYASIMPPGIYNDNLATTGNPVYYPLNCNLDVNYDYTFSSSAEAELTGTYRLSAVISDNVGWERQIPLVKPDSFEGNAYSNHTTIDLCEFQELAQSMKDATHARNSLFVITFKPQVDISGSLNGRPLTDAFSPDLVFLMDDQQVYLPTSFDGTRGTLTPSEESLIPGEKTISNTMDVLGLTMAVKTARQASVAMLAFGLVGVLLPILHIYRRHKDDINYQAQYLHGSRLVRTAEIGALAGGRVVDLEGMKDLANLAERTGQVILCQSNNDQTVYYLQEGDITYRYSPGYVPADGGFKLRTFNQEIERAIAMDEFKLYFQPVLSYKTNRVNQVEALLRWQHPERGELRARDFITYLEQTGLIGDVDRIGLTKAVKQLSQWNANGYCDIQMNINISPATLSEEGLTAELQEILREADVAPANIQFEVTSVINHPTQATFENLKRLSALGISFSMGYISSENLEGAGRLAQINTIKLNPAMVEDALRREAGEEEIRAYIKNAHQRRMKVVALGIESPEQYAFFAKTACDAAQGYLISPPLNSTDIELLFSKDRVLDLKTRV